MSILSTQILFLNSILHPKEAGLLGEMADYIGGVGKGKMNLECFVLLRNKKALKEW